MNSILRFRFVAKEILKAGWHLAILIGNEDVGANFIMFFVDVCQD
jgi:hypothetical protein